MKNAFYFILKALFVFKIFKFLISLFVHVVKTSLIINNFQIYDATTLLINNYNKHIAQYLRKLRQSDNETWLFKRL